jgi:hypothetical protein
MLFFVAADLTASEIMQWPLLAGMDVAMMPGVTSM